MLILRCELKSESPISFGKAISSVREPNEDFGDFEQRIWKEKMHVDSSGKVIVPGSFFVQGFPVACRYMGKAVQIPGQGQERYTKHFEAGVRVYDSMVLTNGVPIKAEQVESETLFLPWPPGSKTRCSLVFPYISEWNGIIFAHVMSDTITLEVFKQVLEYHGLFIGLGRWRSEKKGNYGRYSVQSIEEITMEEYLESIGKNQSKKKKLLVRK